MNTQTRSALLIFGLASMFYAKASVSAAERELDSLLTERVALTKELQSMRAQYIAEAPEAQQRALQQWRIKNNAKLQALRNKAQHIAAKLISPELPLINALDIPADATLELEEFMVANAELHNSRAKVLNSMRTKSKEEGQSAISRWREHNLQRLQEQRGRALVISAAEANIANLRERAPDGVASDPKLQQFLSERHQYMQDRGQEENRIRALPAEEQAQARMTWARANVDRAAELRRHAQQLSAKAAK